jgi:molybdopterin converting factor subunit 1
MKIQLLFFGITTDLVGLNSMSFEVEKKTSISDLKNILIIKYPRLKNIHEFAIAINEEYATDDLLINENDIIAIIPPVSGG